MSLAGKSNSRIFHNKILSGVPLSEVKLGKFTHPCQVVHYVKSFMH